MIIGILGKAGSGKNTVTNIIMEELFKRGINCKDFAFADPLKRVASEFLGCHLSYLHDQRFKKTKCFSLTDGKIYSINDVPEGHETLTIREVLQKLGTEAIQGTFGKRVWVNNTFLSISTYFPEFHKDGIAFITDVRFKHELDSITGLTIRVVNPSLVSNDSHSSETELDECSTDFTIVNDWQNNPKALKPQIDELIQQIERRFRNK